MIDDFDSTSRLSKSHIVPHINPIEMEDEDHDLSMTVMFAFEGVLLLSVGILGIIGNIASIVVFTIRLKIQRNFHALMICLAIFDLIYIIANILIFTIPLFSDNYLTSGTYYYVMPWALPIAQIGMTGSIYFTMAMTAERYLTVCHPFYRHSHNWPTRNYIIPITAFCFIYNIPRFFEMETRSTTRNDTLTSNISDTSSLFISDDIDRNSTLNYQDDNNLYEFVIVPTSLRLNRYYYSIYHVWLNFFSMGLFPFTLLIVLNTQMIIKLLEIEKRSIPPCPGNNHLLLPNTSQENNLQNCCKKDAGMAKVSLGIAFVFITCHSVRWIPNIYELWQLGTEPIIWPFWIECITNLSHFLTTLNCSVNFYIYYAKHHRQLHLCHSNDQGLQLEDLSGRRQRDSMGTIQSARTSASVSAISPMCNIDVR